MPDEDSDERPEARHPEGDVDPVEPSHRPDGLDLARSIARSYKRLDGNGRPRPRRRGTKKSPAPPRSSGAHPDDRDPQTLDATLGRLVAEHGWETDVAVHAMFGRWAAIVGEEISQHSEPQGYADKILTVRADSTAWATQLRMLAPRIVAQINERVGDGTVTRIQVVGPQGPSWTKGGRSVRGRGPRDTYG